MNRKYYICWYCLDSQHRFLIWYSNDKDGVLAEHGKVPSFSSQEELFRYALTHLIDIQAEQPFLHDLDKVARWLDGPSADSIDCQAFSAAWNLFADVSSSVGDNFDSDPKLTQKVYDKIFYGLNLPAVTPEDKLYEPVWTIEEVQLIREVLGRGLNLFRLSIEEKV
jgi:hypothetical protein